MCAKLVQVERNAKKILFVFIAGAQPNFVDLGQRYSFIFRLLTEILPNDDFVLQTAICIVKPETIQVIRTHHLNALVVGNYFAVNLDDENIYHIFVNQF